MIRVTFLPLVLCHPAIPSYSFLLSISVTSYLLPPVLFHPLLPSYGFIVFQSIHFRSHPSPSPCVIHSPPPLLSPTFIPLFQITHPSSSPFCHPLPPSPTFTPVTQFTPSLPFSFCLIHLIAYIFPTNHLLIVVLFFLDLLLFFLFSVFVSVSVSSCAFICLVSSIKCVFIYLVF